MAENLRKEDDVRSRMHSGRLYYCTDESLLTEQAEYMEILYDFNQTRPSQGARRAQLLKELLAEVGENCYIEPPLRANWGKHTHLGNDVYANFNLVLVDDTDIYIGNNVLMGPNVIIDTGTHPVRPDIRARQAQFNMPVTIGNNVWLGAGVIVLPGVHIGDNTVIGAGSVVTADIPSNTVAMGTPCRVVRQINDKDMEYYYKDLKIDIIR